MSKTSSLRMLKEEWADCDLCSLVQLRNGAQPVFGTGKASADILIVTDAPSASDVWEGSSLTGEIGEAFRTVCAAAGIDFKTLFRTSLVACRPFVTIPATEDDRERDQDRRPAKAEIDACTPRLLELIYHIDPRLIITAGFGSFKALVKTKDRGRDSTTIGKAQGKLCDAYIPGRVYPIRYPVLALLPPEQMLNNPSTATHGPIATTTEALHGAARYLRWLKQNEKKDLQ